MFAPSFSVLLALASALAGVSSALPGRASRLAQRDTDSDFSLFAYGSNSDTEIGGYPIFYNNGYAYISNPAKVNFTANYVAFTQSTSDSTIWLANPLSALNQSWSDSLLYIPVPSGPAGFYKEGVTNETEVGDVLTTGFRTYGSTVLVSIDGSMQSEWYAVETEIDGLWSVGWNASTGVADSEPIGLRKGKPINVDFPEKR